VSNTKQKSSSECELIGVLPSIRQSHPISRQII